MRIDIKRGSALNIALLDQGLVSLANFISGLLLVRIIGTEQYGVFVLSWAAVQLVQSIQNALIIAPMQTFVPTLVEVERIRYLNGSATSQLAISAVIAIVAVLIGMLSVVIPWGALSGQLHFAVAVAALGAMAHNFVRRYSFVASRPAVAMVVDSVNYILLLIWLVAYAMGHFPSVDEVLRIYTICGLVAASAGWFLLKIRLGPISSAIGVISKNWRSGKWLLGSAILQWMSGNNIIVTAGSILDSSTVGAIKAAQNIVGVLHVIFLGLENYLPISFADKASKNSRLVGLSVLRWALAISVLAAGAVLVLSFFSEKAVLLVYGLTDKRIEAAIGWFVFSYALIGATMPLQSGLRAVGGTKGIFVSYVAAAAVSLGFGPAAILKFGFNGVMAMLLLVNATILLISVAYFRRVILVR